MYKPTSSIVLLFLLVGSFMVNSPGQANERPNILFISVDDLNDWIGCLGGHPQARTPNFDRLAKSSLLFTNAHCPAPACNPSRTAVLTGLAPNESGLYSNRQKMREILPRAELMPRYFSRYGYWSAGSGKILHYFIDAPSWNEYFPQKESENPFPRTLYPKKRPVSLPRGGPWQYVETDWGPLDATDAEFGGDYLVSDWIGKQLRRKHDQPFFLACGIYRPHEPWFVPRKYFDRFPLTEIQLPPGYKADDLDDLPPAGRRRGPNRYFAHIRKNKQWKKAIQGYLASISFADEMLGRVLDALEQGPHAKNTIVVLWSDHGWHLGEKQHWQKYSAWRACTRVPLMIKVPKGTPGLPKGTLAGANCHQPVNLVSLFATLTELTGVPQNPETQAPSLVSLLRDPSASWEHPSITYLAEKGSVGISFKRYRLIHYANGDEEFYDIQRDPFEWNNLLAGSMNDSVKQRLAACQKHIPSDFAEYVKPSVDSLVKLKWTASKSLEEIPSSKPDGQPFDCYFINKSASGRKLYWMDRSGGKKYYATIKTGETQRQSTRPGAIWMIADLADRPLGYFAVDDRSAKGEITE